MKTSAKTSKNQYLKRIRKISELNQKKPDYSWLDDFSKILSDYSKSNIQTKKPTIPVPPVLRVESRNSRKRSPLLSEINLKSKFNPYTAVKKQIQKKRPSSSSTGTKVRFEDESFHTSCLNNSVSEWKKVSLNCKRRYEFSPVSSQSRTKQNKSKPSIHSLKN